MAGIARRGYTDAPNLINGFRTTDCEQHKQPLEILICVRPHPPAAATIDAAGFSVHRDSRLSVLGSQLPTAVSLPPSVVCPFPALRAASGSTDGGRIESFASFGRTVPHHRRRRNKPFFKNHPVNLSGPPTASEHSLVVLPLENLSPDSEHAFFPDGLLPELINAFSTRNRLGRGSLSNPARTTTLPVSR